jgi:anti-sigma factor RsiW
MGAEPTKRGNAHAEPVVGLPVMTAEPVCREVLVIIQCYVDCECDVSTMLAVAAHIEHCPSCQEELNQLRWLKAAVRRCHQSPSGSIEREA